MNNAKKQLTNLTACGALGCATAHLLGASPTTACAAGTCAALGSAKSRQAIDYVFGNTQVVNPYGKIFKTKIEYYKSLTPQERIEMLSLMTPEYFKYIFDGPEYLALIEIPKDISTVESSH